MPQPLGALGEYRERLERARQEARAELAAAAAGLAGKQIACRRLICGPPRKDEKLDVGTVAAVESVLDHGYPDFIVLRLTTGGCAYINPAEEDILVFDPQ